MAISDAYDELADDWSDLEEIEEVTLQPYDASEDPIEEVKALRIAGGRGQQDAAETAFIAGLGLEVDYARFRLWTSTLGGHTPSRGDQITDDRGDVWLVEGAKELTARTGWRVICRPFV